MISLLAHLLHVANAAPPYGDWRREKFYAIKDRMLRTFGAPAGFDVQFITKPCWGPRWGSCTQDADCKCGGSGIFDFYWVKLERWKLGGRIFHRPVALAKANTWGPVTIEGIVKHPHYGLWPRECQMYLALAAGEFLLFWELVYCLRHNWPTGWKLPPLTCLAKLWNQWEMSPSGRWVIKHVKGEPPF